MVTQNSEDNREIAYCSDSEPESSHILDLIPNDDENLPVDQNVTNQNPPVNRPHRCGICRKKVKSLISLTKHMNEHTKRQGLKLTVIKTSIVTIVFYRYNLPVLIKTVESWCPKIG